MTEIAHGTIGVEVKDTGAMASLRRVETEFSRTMHNIDRQEAEVRIKANIRDFDRELEKAKRELRVLKAEKTEVSIEADKKELDRKIKQVQRDIVFLDGMKATVEIEVEGEKEALNAQREIAKAEEARSKAAQKYHDDRMRALQKEARRNAALSDQKAREYRQDEAAAHRMQAQMDREAVNEQQAAQRRLRDLQQEARRRSGLAQQREKEMRDAETAAYREHDARTVGVAKEKAQVLQLQREYAKLTDRIESLGKRHAFTSEARAKLELDTASAYAEMEATKAALNRLGGHPPVGIKVDLDRRGIRRVTGAMADVAKRVAQGAANLPNVVLRLGPFAATIKQFGVAMAFLGPSLVDLAGAATSLIGVLGTGLTGAMTIGAGTAAGLATNLLGVKFALTPMITDFKIGTAAVQAYHKAVLLYGKGSDEAAKKQDQMNQALRTMDPSAQAAAKAVGSLGDNWRKLTSDQANRSFINVVGEYARTMRTLQPTLAGNTNRTIEILDERLTAMLTHLRSTGAAEVFDSLGRSANNFLNPFLDGLQHLGSFLGKVAESAARLFAGPAGNAFKSWARGLDEANQRGQDLDDKIRRLGEHAKSVGSFFLALGRLIVTVLNGSADSGKSLIDDMTNKLNEWNDALSKTEGQEKMRDFFERSADGAKTLYHTFGPLIAEFVRWSSLLAPFATGFLKGVNAVGKLIGKLLDLVHLGGSVTTFAATLGALWAVGRIGNFISFVLRAASAVKALGAAQTVAGLATRSFGARAAAAGVPLAADAAATAAAARAAGAGGKAAPAIERAGAAGAGAAGGVSKFGTALRFALPFLARFGGPAGIAAGAALLFGGRARDAADDVHDLNEQTSRIHVNVAGAGQASVSAFNAMADGTLSLKASVREVNAAQKDYNRLQAQGKGNTAAGVAALQRLNMAIDARTAAEQKVGAAMRTAQRADAELQNTLPKLRAAQRAWNEETAKGAPEMRRWIDLSDEANQATLRRIKAQTGRGAAQLTGEDLVRYGDALKPIPGYEDEWAKALRELKVAHENLVGAQGDTRKAADQFALASINAKRAIAGFKPMTDEAAAAIRQLNQSIGQIKTAKISMKFPDPRQARQVMQGVNSAINAGVPKSKAVNVALNSRSAEQAIRRLNALKLNAKILTIRAREGDALAAIARVRGVKLPAKVLKLLHEGDPNVIAAVRKILGIRLPPKTLVMLGNALDALGKSRIVKAIDFATKFARFAGINDTSGALAAALNAGLAWASRVFLATFGAKHTKAQGGPVVGFASGGHGKPDTSGPVLRARQEAALREARSNQPTQRRAGKFSRPTLLVGEERRTEYVIATNPAYRRANLNYLAAAASELGVRVVEPRDNTEGVVMAASGLGQKRPKHVPKPGSRGRHGQASGHHIGPVDTSDLDAAYQRAKNALATAKSMVGNKKSARKSATGARTAKGKTHQRNTRNRLTKEINYLNRTTIPHLRREMNKRKHFLDAANSAHEKFDILDTRIDTARTRMSNADAAGNQTDFDKWRKALIGKNRKGGLLRERLKKLRAAIKDAKKGGRSRWVAQLENEIARTSGEIGEIGRTKSQKQQEEAQTNAQTRGDTNRQYVEDAVRYGIRQTKNTAAWHKLVDEARKQFSGATRAVAESQLTQDNPLTPTDEAMDARTAANQRLVNFWQAVYARTKTLGNDQAVTDAANELFSARNALSDGASAAGSFGQSALYSDARAALLTQFGSNTAGVPRPVWAQPAPASLSGFSGASASGGGGVAGSSGGPATVHINNTFASVPPDPHTWSQGVAFEAATAF